MAVGGHTLRGEHLGDAVVSTPAPRKSYRIHQTKNDQVQCSHSWINSILAGDTGTSMELQSQIVEEMYEPDVVSNLALVGLPTVLTVNDPKRSYIVRLRSSVDILTQEPNAKFESFGASTRHVPSGQLW